MQINQCFSNVKTKDNHRNTHSPMYFCWEEEVAQQTPQQHIPICQLGFIRLLI